VLVMGTTAISTVVIVANVPELQSLVIDNTAGMVAFVAGLVVGHYASPDTRDVNKKRTKPEQMVSERFGRFAGNVWSAIWEPLARRIPHRSWLSHLPGPATIMAAAWLYAVPLTALWWYSPTWFAVVWALKWWHVAGWMIQDTVHLAQDDFKVKW